MFDCGWPSLRVAADSVCPERSRLAALLCTNLCARDWFATSERFLFILGDFLLLLLGVNELVPSCTAWIKPLHENGVSGFWFCHCDRGVAGFHTFCGDWLHHCVNATISVEDLDRTFAGARVSPPECVGPRRQYTPRNLIRRTKCDFS